MTLEIRGENNDISTEHDELFASFALGPFNDGEKAAHSSMVAILEEWLHTQDKDHLSASLNCQRSYPCSF